MEGTSIAQAKQALLMALDRLTPDDAFNIVQFNSVTDVLFNSSVTASAANIAKARDYVKALRATGGTEMAPALTAALNNSDNQRVLRQVIFLTDGAVATKRNYSSSSKLGSATAGCLPLVLVQRRTLTSCPKPHSSVAAHTPISARSMRSKRR
jgi:hypothetical protein